MFETWGTRRYWSRWWGWRLRTLLMMIRWQERAELSWSVDTPCWSSSPPRCWGWWTACWARVRGWPPAGQCSWCPAPGWTWDGRSQSWRCWETLPSLGCKVGLIIIDQSVVSNLPPQAVTWPHIHFIINFPALDWSRPFKHHPVLLSRYSHKLCQRRKCEISSSVAHCGQISRTVFNSQWWSSFRYIQRLARFFSNSFRFWIMILH